MPIKIFLSLEYRVVHRYFGFYFESFHNAALPGRLFPSTDYNSLTINHLVDFSAVLFHAHE